MGSRPNTVEFDLPNRWHCWQNDITGEWGAILSRKGDQPIIIDGKKRKEELFEAIGICEE